MPRIPLPSVAAAALVWALAACGPAAAPVPPRSVLVLTMDTTRWDHMGFLGRQPSLTPHLDQLAARSVVFEDAMTVTPLTLPAHASLMTGLYPRSHGVRVNSNLQVSAEAVTLAEVLRDGGWDTGAAVAAYVLDPVFGLDQGFTRYDAPLRTPGVAELTMVERPGPVMVDQALAMLDQMEGPFFFWLHLFDPHFPYQPPGPLPGPLPTNQNQRERMLYAAEIQGMDQQIGRLFEALDQRGLFEDLVVVVASDHGESLGEHGESTHGYFVYDPTMRVPLVLHHPDLPPQRVSTPVSLVDVMPTLLSLLGVEHDGLSFDGLDLAAGLRGEEPFDAGRLRALESYHLYFHHSWAPYEALVSGPWKYIHSRRSALYDRVADPGETADRLAEDPERARTLAQRVDAFFGQPAVLTPTTHEMSEEERQALERLGYVGGASSGTTARPDFRALPAAEDQMDLLIRWEEATQASVTGRPLMAVNILRELVQRAPDSPDFHQQLGAMLLNALPDELDEAEAALRAAVKIQFRLPKAHFNLGLCAMRRATTARQAGDQEALRRYRIQALDEFLVALDIEPGHPESRANAALLQIEEAADQEAQGRPPEAVRKLRQDAIDNLRRFLQVVAEHHPRRPRYEEMIAEQEALLAGDS